MEEGNGDGHGSREGENRQTEKKEIYKYLRERGEEKTPLRLAKARKHVHIHFTNIVACWLFIALSFIYIEGGI